MIRRSENLDMSFAKRKVCSASSRVGDNTRPRIPKLVLWLWSFWIIGRRKVHVLPGIKFGLSCVRFGLSCVRFDTIHIPDPVLAIHTKSIPARAIGRAFLWTGVGTLYPILLSPFKSSCCNSILWKLPLDGAFVRTIRLFSLICSFSRESCDRFGWVWVVADWYFNVCLNWCLSIDLSYLWCRLTDWAIIRGRK